MHGWYRDCHRTWESLLGKCHLPKMPLMKIAWCTQCTIAVQAASDVDVVIDACDYYFHVIGDPSISRKYPVMLLRLCLDLSQNSEYPTNVLMSSSALFL